MKNPEDSNEAIRIIERFESLPIERRVAIFRDLSPQAREELVSVLTRPGEIIRRVSPEEMYFTIKQVGEENATSLITMTTSKQLLYMLDIDLWKHDTLNVPVTARWLEIISTIGEPKILQFVQTVDGELLLSAMSRLVRVVIRDPEIGLVEQEDLFTMFTLDDTYYLEFRSTQYEEPVKRFLDAIFRWNPHYYFGLMQELAGGLAQEQEEFALKWRQARLYDMGFPEFDEAIEIYQYLRRSAVCDPDAEPTDPGADTAHESLPILGYPLKLVNEDTPFRNSLNGIADPAQRDRVARELAHLANKVMIADGRDPGSVESLVGSLEKVSGYINIALEEMCGDDVAQAMGLIRSNHLEILFRRAFSLILDLRKEGQKLLREYEGVVENLGHPLAGLMSGLLHKRPYFAGHVLGDPKPREFRSFHDLATIRSMMDRTAVEEKWEDI